MQTGQSLSRDTRALPRFRCIHHLEPIDVFHRPAGYLAGEDGAIAHHVHIQGRAQGQGRYYSRKLLLNVQRSRHCISLQRDNDRSYYARKSGELWAIIDDMLGEEEQIPLCRFGGKAIQPRPRLSRLAGRASGEPGDWRAVVQPEDLLALLVRLAEHAGDGALTFRLQGPGDGLTVVLAVLDNFKYVGPGLSIFKRAPAAA